MTPTRVCTRHALAPHSSLKHQDSIQACKQSSKLQMPSLFTYYGAGENPSFCERFRSPDNLHEFIVMHLSGELLSKRLAIV